MTTDDIIAAFGGRDAVMEITGKGRNHLNNWRHDGVPFRHWQALIEAAEERSIPGITMKSLRSTRPVRAKEAA